MSERYIIVKAYVDDDYDRIISLWNESITYNKHHFYHQEVQINSIRDVIFDVKTKALSKGKVLDLYPGEVVFHIGEDVYVEGSVINRTIFCSQKGVYKSRIVDIVYSEFETEVIKGSKIEKYMLEKITKQHKDFKLESECLYWIKHWQPHFLLSNDKVIKHSYYLFKVLDEIN